MQNATTFDRPFASGDETRFMELLGDIRGQTLQRVDALYGGGISLHVGSMIEGRRGQRGAWIITCWGGDLLRLPAPSDEASSGAWGEATAQSLEAEVGAALKDAVLDVASLSLELALSTGTHLRLQIDPSFDGDSWMVALPNRSTLGFGRQRRWSLESDASTAT